MLIDESERTFKRGLIVTATVTKILEDKGYSSSANLTMVKMQQSKRMILRRQKRN